MAADIKKARGIDSTLIKGAGGVFDVVADGKMLFSKKKVGRFPDTAEILDQIPAT